jgi:hypothetical protein
VAAGAMDAIFLSGTRELDDAELVGPGRDGSVL